MFTVLTTDPFHTSSRISPFSTVPSTFQRCCHKREDDRLHPHLQRLPPLSHQVFEGGCGRGAFISVPNTVTSSRLTCTPGCEQGLAICWKCWTAQDQRSNQRKRKLFREFSFNPLFVYIDSLCAQLKLIWVGFKLTVLQVLSLLEWFVGGVWLICIGFFNVIVKNPTVCNRAYASSKPVKQRRNLQ